MKLLPHEHYARDLLARLYREHRVKHHRTLFRVVSRSYTRFAGGRPQIVLGHESLQRAFEKGFEEYPSVAWVLAGRRPVGLEGVHQLCLHEFAHVLQYRQGGFRGRCAHNAVFVRHYRDLMQRHPPPPP